ncbi:MAG: outer membrane lipid asymmetry maintenance protein MlaD [Pseudomonadales bacterium]
MRMRTIEISVGAFVLAGVLALVFLALRVSGVTEAQRAQSYELHAKFDDVAGLRKRAKVTVAGVKIGEVKQIDVDLEYGEAEVTFEIHGEPGLLSVDTGAQIVTEGILGTRYVSLMLGADEETLADGDKITDTQGALVLEKLIGDFISRMGS